MNDIKIFDNPEFGNVRTMLINDEPWFVGKDIADALGYVDTRHCLLDHVDVEDRKSLKYKAWVKTVPSLWSTSNDYMDKTVINESGVYSLIFGSKLESAKKFKRWVTNEVLPSIRKTGGYQMPITTDEKIMLLAQGHTELKQEIDEVKSDLATLKMDLPILPIEESRITTAVKKRGVDVMGGQTSNAYRNKNLRAKVYSNIYANLKYNFGVKSYKAIKRSQVEEAITIINNYKPPFHLVETIDSWNAQQSFMF